MVTGVAEDEAAPGFPSLNCVPIALSILPEAELEPEPESGLEPAEEEPVPEAA